MTATGDADAIRSIAVHRDDVAAALEASLRSDRDVVLRVTPPFSGRMRARIHDRTDLEESDREAGAIHLPPADLIDDPPAYPEPDETTPAGERATGADGYDVEKHYERHTDAVAAWRDAVRESVADSVVLGDGDAAREVRVVPLG